MTEESQAPEPESTESTPRTPRYDSVGDAMSAGRNAAEEKAKNSATATSDFVGAAVQDLAYGAAFGICFTGYFVRELVPERVRHNVVRGLRRGKTAAKHAAEDLCCKNEEVVPPPVAPETA